MTYTPDAGYAGTDTYTYVVSSTNGTSSTATDSIVSPPPAAAQLAPAQVSAAQTPAAQVPAAQAPAAQVAGGAGAGGAGAGAGSAGGTGAPGATPGAGAGAAVVASPKGDRGIAGVSITGGGRAGSAVRLSGPARCVDTRFKASVIGRDIARVKFYFDGKWRRTIKAKPGQTVFSQIIDHAASARACAASRPSHVQDSHRREPDDAAPGLQALRQGSRQTGVHRLMRADLSAGPDYRLRCRSH